jgi:hypothetical protein
MVLLIWSFLEVVADAVGLVSHWRFALCLLIGVIFAGWLEANWTTGGAAAPTLGFVSVIVAALVGWLWERAVSCRTDRRLSDVVLGLRCLVT